MRSLNLSVYAPKEHLLPSEWAEQNVVIPASGNARPGRLSFLDSPFQKSILDAVVDPTVERITIKSAAQIGKTLTALCMLGYFTDHEPMSQMLMMPTQTDMDKFLTTKFNPLLDANPRLRSLYAPPRGREGVNNRVQKEFSGGILTLSWAGSPNTARGISAPIIVADEVDGYEFSPEGHPVDLLFRRSATFGNQRKLIEMSTPTVIHQSRIDESFMQGNMCEYEVICEKCSQGWFFDWEDVKYNRDDVSTAKIHCPNCDTGYDDMGRIKLVRYAVQDGGGWKATKDTKAHLSFHLSSLHSPLQRLRDVVSVYLAAEDEPMKLATFYNTCLGETFERTGETADAHELEARCEDYPAPVPKGVKVLTAGIDVQKDRLECEIVGWAAEDESWNIAYEVFPGDTNNPNDQCYKYLWNFLTRGFDYESGGKMFIEAAAIDTGFNTLCLYQVVRTWQGRIPSVFAVKGIGGWNRDALKGVKATLTYKGYRPPLFSIGVDIVKRIIMSSLNVTKEGQGYCHFPMERAEGEYFRQLTSEVLLYDPMTGKRKWEKKDASDNEALDCRVYAYAALHIRKPDLTTEMRHGLRGVGQKAKGVRYSTPSFKPN